MTNADATATIGRPRRKRRELFAAPTIVPCKHYAPGEIIPLEDLKRALVEAAKLIEIDQRAIPVFQRIENEILKREEQEFVFARAMSLIKTQNVTP